MAASNSEKEKLQSYLEYLVKNQPPPELYFAKNRTKKGGEIDIQVDWDYKLDEEGKIIGFISIITDITEK